MQHEYLYIQTCVLDILIIFFYCMFLDTYIYSLNAVIVTVCLQAPKIVFYLLVFNELIIVFFFVSHYSGHITGVNCYRLIQGG